MKSMSVRSAQHPIMALVESNQPNRMDFIGQVQELYHLLSQYKNQPGFPSKLHKPQQPKRKSRPQRTRSKSGRKRKDPASPTRKSSRIAQLPETHKQIDKQPLWNPHKLSSRPPSKIPLVPQLIEPTIFKKIPRAKPSEPLYEFYSAYSEEENQVVTKQKLQNKKPKKGRLQITTQLSKQIQIEEGNYSENLEKENVITTSFNYLGHQAITEKENVEPQYNVNDQEIDEWKPDKSFAQLLKIQQIIDQFFLFKASFRPNRTMELEEIVKFIRDIQGYYFDRTRFQKLIYFNSNLYKLIRVKGVWLIKMPTFKETDIEDRIKQTKISMIRYCRKEAAQAQALAN